MTKYLNFHFFFLNQLTGQPVLIGGTMGTCSYVLTGTEQGMTETFGTTCHGAVRHQRKPRALALLSGGLYYTPLVVF